MQQADDVAEATMLFNEALNHQCPAQDEASHAEKSEEEDLEED